MGATPSTYTELTSALHQAAKAARIPIEATIEVSHRCPLVCQHCYNNLPMADASARHRELTLDEHTRILDEIVAAGCVWLCYTGGEIFARRDFLDIYLHAKRRGLLITLFTNATLITARIADLLAEYRPFSIEVTMYGATAATYEQLTQVPGSHKQCMRGIHLLLERGLPLKLKTVAVTVNRHEVWAMKRLAQDLGVEFKFDALMSPRIDCSQSPLSVRLSPEEVVAFDLDDPFRAAEWRRQMPALGPAAAAAAGTGEIYYCGGGLTTFAIDPYGEMSICTLSHQDTWNLREGTFADGWNHFLKRVRGKQLTRETKCVACQLKAACSMCPATGELENGSPEAPVDFLCRVGHLRAYAFGLDVPAHGQCEYCPGGAGYAELARQADALRARQTGTESVFAGDSLRLPMLVSSTGSTDACGGGCGSCGCETRS